MERLVDGKDTRPELEKAREVLLLARPPAVTKARMQRVRWALERRVRAKPLVGLPLLVGGALLLLGASALAAFGAGMLGTKRDPVSSVPGAPALPNIEAQAPRGDRRPVRDVEAPKEATPAPENDAPPPKERPMPPARSRAETNADIERIHNAAAALRREGDPAKAAKLLESIDPRKSGPLAEEALALRIEAALSQRDPKARQLATTYLRRYPAGRYAAAAREALRSTPP